MTGASCYRSAEVFASSEVTGFLFGKQGGTARLADPILSLCLTQGQDFCLFTTPVLRQNGHGPKNNCPEKRAEREEQNMEKRNVTVEEKKGLKSTRNLILVGVMMAVGVVLRLFAGVIAVGNR